MVWFAGALRFLTVSRVGSLFDGAAAPRMTNDWFDAKVTGFAEIDRNLREFPKQVQRRVIRASLTAGAKVIADEAARRVPVDTGNLRHSVRVRSTARSGVPKALVMAGHRSKVYKNGRSRKASKKNGNTPPYYAYYIEFGTAKMPAQPFMRPAMDYKNREALGVIADEMRRRISEIRLPTKKR